MEYFELKLHTHIFDRGKYAIWQIMYGKITFCWNVYEGIEVRHLSGIMKNKTNI